MTHGELRKVLLPEYRRMNKRDFVAAMQNVYDPKVRVGGPKGKGRITAKRALLLLGVPDDSFA